MAYLSMCIKSINNIKEGEVFRTYHVTEYRVEKVGISRVSDFGEEYIPGNYKFFDFEIFRMHFVEVSTCCSIYYLEKHKTNLIESLNNKFSKKNQLESQLYSKLIHIPFSIEYIIKFYSQCYLYLLLIKNKELLCNFYDTINYTLTSLTELYSQKDILDFDNEIKKATDIFKEIYTYCNDMDKKCNNTELDVRTKYVNEIMHKHNKVMKDTLEALKLLNKK